MRETKSHCFSASGRRETHCIKPSANYNPQWWILPKSSQGSKAWPNMGKPGKEKVTVGHDVAIVSHFLLITLVSEHNRTSHAFWWTGINRLRECLGLGSSQNSTWNTSRVQGAGEMIAERKDEGGKHSWREEMTHYQRLFLLRVIGAWSQALGRLENVSQNCVPETLKGRASDIGCHSPLVKCGPQRH